MRYSLLTQIGLIGMSVIIFITVINPLFADIAVIQDERVVYADAVDKAQQFNLSLQELVATRDSFSAEDLKQLELLLPDTVDAPKVMRDIESIFAIRKVPLTSVKPSEGVETVVYADEGNETPTEGVESPLAQRDFEVNFEGSYEDLKGILTLAESNETLLEVVALKFGVLSEGGAARKPTEEQESGTFLFTLVFRSYGLAESAS
jgi:hypothetical protein